MSVPFKDDEPRTDKKMLRCRLFIVKDLDNRKLDDTLAIYDVENNPDMFRIVYHSSDYSRKQTQFHLTRSTTLNYIEDLLRSLKYDTEPFEYVQVSTEIHPSVLYHMMDLEKLTVRNLIGDMIHTALKYKIESVLLPRQVVIQ